LAERKDDIDPELVSLPRSRGLRPVLGVSLLGLAVYFAVILRADLMYGFVEETPREVALADVKGDNTFVSVVAPLDHTAAGRLRGRQSSGSRLTPLLGTDGHGWLHEPAEALAAYPREDQRLVGRLRRLDAMDFADELATFQAEQPPIPRLVFPDAIKDTLPETDVHGNTLVTAPDTRIVVVERVPSVALVTVLQTQQIYEDPVAQRALVGAGVLSEPRPPVAADDASWTYEVPAPEGVPGVLAKLRAAKIFGASATDKVLRHETTAGKLALTDGALQLETSRVPMASVDHLVYHVRLPGRPPADSWVILAGDSPATYWYVKHVYAVLALLALFVVWSTVRWFRGVTPATTKSGDAST
jgi:hypothetical protein